MFYRRSLFTLVELLPRQRRFSPPLFISRETDEFFLAKSSPSPSAPVRGCPTPRRRYFSLALVAHVVVVVRRYPATEKTAVCLSVVKGGAKLRRCIYDAASADANNTRRENTISRQTPARRNESRVRLRIAVTVTSRCRRAAYEKMRPGPPRSGETWRKPSFYYAPLYGARQ